MITDPIKAMKACLGQIIQGMEVDTENDSVVIILPNGKIALAGGSVEMYIEPKMLDA